MADQAVAQGSTLKSPYRESPQSASGFLRQLAGGWRFGRCWTRYIFMGASRGMPGLVDFVVGNHFFIALQVPEELSALGEILAARRPERALEIGTARGGTLFFLTRLASPNATIVSVDLPGGKFGGGYSRTRGWFYKRFVHGTQQIHLLRGDSHTKEMLERVKTALGGQALDYLFIDGDHTSAGVKRDFEMYGPMVRKGGLIAFHDIAEGPDEKVGGVPEFWRQIKRRFRHAEIIRNPGQDSYGIGVLYVD